MDTRFLQSFVCVAEVGSIAEAARRLGITSASVAQRLKALEDTLGSPLTVRSGRTVRPTPAGMRILEHARVLLRQLENLKSAASETELPAGPLRLGATPSTLTGLVPGILKDWVTVYPDIGIHIDPASSRLLRERVERGELDGAVVVHPQFRLPKTLAWHTLRIEPLILLAPEALEVTDVLETVAREPFIRYDRDSIGGKLAERYLNQKQVQVRVRFELDSIVPIARLVEEGLGVSVLPDWSETGGVGARVRRWPLPPPCPERSIGVVWLRSSVRSQLVEAFVRVARTDRGAL